MKKIHAAQHRLRYVCYMSVTLILVGSTQWVSASRHGAALYHSTSTMRTIALGAHLRIIGYALGAMGRDSISSNQAVVLGR
jgi:hypothetical protein